MKNFETLNLNKQIVKSILNERFKEPTPIQEAIIPPILNFSDVIGIAQTGTGKTAAYMLPLIHNITKNKSSYENRCCKSLVLLPTSFAPPALIVSSLSVYSLMIRHGFLSIALSSCTVPLSVKVIKQFFSN